MLPCLEPSRLKNDKSQSIECSTAMPLVALVTVGLSIVHPKDATRTSQRERDLVVRGWNNPSLCI